MFVWKLGDDIEIDQCSVHGVFERFWIYYLVQIHQDVKNDTIEHTNSYISTRVLHRNSYITLENLWLKVNEILV